MLVLSRRFLPKVSERADWARERSHEAYAKNYAIVYKNDEPLAGRNQIQSPLHSALLDAGCVFQERGGWERAGYFSSEGRNVAVPPYDWYAQDEVQSARPNGYAEQLEQEYTFGFPRTHDHVRRTKIKITQPPPPPVLLFYPRIYTHAGFYGFPALQERNCSQIKTKCKISMLFLDQNFMLFPMVHLFFLVV
jgi:hypothetical protein